VLNAVASLTSRPAPLTPLYDRRTVYGRVSRYKLDEFLQLFDFPSPNLSAEKRFTTSVPLQRLFFMNSDFMQQQGERLARLVESEPDNAGRIRKAYRLILGRTPTEPEVKAGLTFLTTEPMKAYEERKATKDTEDAKDAKDGKDGKGTKATEAKKKASRDDDEKADAPDKEELGMMAGVIPGAAKKDDEKKLLPPTTLGRYMKILLSSNEFLFVE